MLIDIHVHSKLTPGGTYTAETILAEAQRQELDGVCITDVEAVGDPVALVELGKRMGIHAFIGVELVTDLGNLLCYPRQLDDELTTAWWAELAEDGEDVSAQAVIDHMTEKGGAVVVAHPYDKSLHKPMGDDVYDIRGFDGIEIYTARSRYTYSDLAIEVSSNMNLPCLGGSNMYDRIEQIGRHATLFAETVKDQAAFVDALKSGEVWAVEMGVKASADGGDRGRGGRGRRDDDRGGRRDRRDDRRDGGRGRGRRGGRDRGPRR